MSVIPVLNHCRLSEESTPPAGRFNPRPKFLGLGLWLHAVSPKDQSLCICLPGDSCFNIFDIGLVLFTWVMDFSIIFCRGIIIAIYLCSRGLSHSSEVCESWLGPLLVLPHSQSRQQYAWHPFLSGLKTQQPAVSHKALAGHMMCYYCINCILVCEKAIPVSPARQLLCFDGTKWSLS